MMAGRASVDKKYIVTMRHKRGMHTDVYEDFEADLIRYTGWKAVRGSFNILERIFEKFFLPRLHYRTFPLNLPSLHRNRIYFSSLSGIEYIKIFQHYSFRAKLKAIYQFDSWTHDNAVNENAFRSFGINIAFVSIKRAAEYFNALRIPGFKAYWIPEAIRCDRYRWLDYGDKNIDFLQYGRRWDWMHKQLLAFCKSRDLRYQYPQDRDHDKSQFTDREALLDGLAKSKIAVCVPKTITHPEIHDLSTVTTRYFECMASKCLILGHAPEDLIALSGYNPVVEVDYSDPVGQLEYLLDHYLGFVPLIEKNYRMIKEGHQWKNRITEIARIIDKASGFEGMT
ncbi:MAG: glycosyltransferase family 1 protein [Deltaproteobacteria bacterium]|nr:glycosyltransferase family 1 protein [Deltaproteobacteria bacterium]